MRMIALRFLRKMVNERCVIASLVILRHTLALLDFRIYLSSVTPRIPRGPIRDSSTQ